MVGTCCSTNFMAVLQCFDNEGVEFRLFFVFASTVKLS